MLFINKLGYCIQLGLISCHVMKKNYTIVLDGPPIQKNEISASWIPTVAVLNDKPRSWIK